jgi:LuxR family transcriptional activator of bioluminescence operon
MLAGYMFRSGFGRCIHAVALARPAEKDTPRIIHIRANFDLGDGVRLAQRFFQEHAVLRDCLRTLAPTRWEPMVKADRQVLRAARPAVLSPTENGTGVMLPVLGVNEEIGVIGFAGTGSAKPRAAIAGRKFTRLYQISSCYHAAAMRFIELPKDAHRHDLSRREIECLRWTALGKTSSEIAQIVGISERTVVFHLRNASAHLDAVNRTHAVARAIVTGVITI